MNDPAAANVCAMRTVRLILASASPRRASLLRGVGWDPEILPAEIDETPETGETARGTVVRLAREKARVVAANLPDAAGRAVLAADTAVVLDGEALGKPADAEDAKAMLRRLSDRTHRVLTGVCLRDGASGVEAHVIDETEVRFRRLQADWIDWYVATGEPMDKAGAYGIQGLGVWLTRSIRGSWSNVVGLPLERLPDLFAAIGADARRPLSR